MPSRTSRPRPISPTTSSSTVTRARQTRCRTARMIRSRGRPLSSSFAQRIAAWKVIPGKSVPGWSKSHETVTMGRGITQGRTMADYTPYQQKIIKRYYDNQDTLAQQRLAELVSELYLAKGKKLLQAWEQAATAMQKLKVPQSRIDHLL